MAQLNSDHHVQDITFSKKTCMPYCRGEHGSPGRPGRQALGSLSESIQLVSWMSLQSPEQIVPTIDSRTKKYYAQKKKYNASLACEICGADLINNDRNDQKHNTDERKNRSKNWDPPMGAQARVATT